MTGVLRAREPVRCRSRSDPCAPGPARPSAAPVERPQPRPGSWFARPANFTSPAPAGRLAARPGCPPPSVDRSRCSQQTATQPGPGREELGSSYRTDAPTAEIVPTSRAFASPSGDPARFLARSNKPIQQAYSTRPKLRGYRTSVMGIAVLVSRVFGGARRPRIVTLLAEMASAAFHVAANREPTAFRRPSRPVGWGAIDHISDRSK